MSIRNDPKLKAAQQILESISSQKLVASVNTTRLLEIQRHLDDLSEKQCLDGTKDQYDALLRERDFRILQDQQAQVEFEIYDTCWNHLTPREQLILHTIHQKGLTREEGIAELCDVIERSESTIWKYYRAALKAFSTLLSL